MAEVTLNKDGSPRKKGSGKTKGAGCFTKIKWNELREYVGENVPIPISRVWLRSLGVAVDEETPEARAETTEEPAVVKDLKPTETAEETTEPVETIDEPVEETPPPLEETAEESPEAAKETPEPSEEEPEPVEVIDEPDEETEDEEEDEDSPPIGAVTPPYRYAQDFDL